MWARISNHLIFHAKDAELELGVPRVGGPGSDVSGSAIHLSAMTHPYHRDHEVATLIRIDDSVWADSKTTKPLPLGAHDRSFVGIVAEAFNRGNDALALGLF